MKKLVPLVVGALISVPFFALAQFDPTMMGPLPEGMMNQGMMEQGMMGPPPEMMEQALKQMQRGIKQMKKGIQQAEKMVAQITKNGISVPEDIATAIANANSAIAKLEGATTMDETTMGVIEEFNEAMEVFRDNQGRIGMLAALPRMEKQARKEIGKLEKRFTSLKKRFTGADVDVSSVIDAVQARIDELKGVLAQALELAKSGDMDAVMETYEEKVFGAMEDTYQLMGKLEALKNMKRALTQVKKGISAGNSTVAKLKRKKVDTAALEEILKNAQVSYDELAALLKTQDFDPEDTFEIFDALDGYREEFEQALEALEDETGEEAGGDIFRSVKGLNFTGNKGPVFKVPDLGFKPEKLEFGGGEGGGFGGFPGF